ncbi:MAG: aminoacyl-tRNA hydrolase [Oligoflexia bacterium]|nr:aminoacyl-tRNA hydrolase [Oligoflexia bacterium]
MRIPVSEFKITYARSSGPGGQNVNKVNSKALLRWNLLESPSLSPELRARLFARLQNRLTREGELLIASDRFRDQGQNREDCIAKLHEILEAAAFVPKTRRKTKPSRSSIRKGKESKSRNSAKKALRRAPPRES